MIGISSDRAKHSLEVANAMYKMSKEKGWDEKKSQEMFSLGYLHDIGYEFSNTQMEHSFVGGKLLKEQGYKYWREVYYHGLVTDKYESEELTLLNIADFSVNSKGCQVSVKERIEDILERYGCDSIQYKDAVELAKQLGIF